MRETSLTLNINGFKYGGWTQFRISRGLDRAVGNFICEVSERWPGSSGFIRQIIPQSTCILQAGNDTILTGYIDDYEASMDKGSHRVIITGRSKTEDIVDCTSEDLGSFLNSTLLATAKKLLEPFNINVVDQLEGTDKANRTAAPLQRAILDASNITVNAQVGLVLQDTIVQPGETVFNFIERLARVQGVLLTDDEQGNLVLTDAGGNGHSASALIQGQNVLTASIKLDFAIRFSDYIVRSQNGLGTPDGVVWTSRFGQTHDDEILRYRPNSIIAETSMDNRLAKNRSQWMKNHALGMSTKAKVKVEGWRQADGSLWRPNQTISVQLDELNLNEELLIIAVNFSLSNEDGFTTELELGRIEGYTPDPAQVTFKPPSAVAAIKPVKE